MSSYTSRIVPAYPGYFGDTPPVNYTTSGRRNNTGPYSMRIPVFSKRPPTTLASAAKAAVKTVAKAIRTGNRRRYKTYNNKRTIRAYNKPKSKIAKLTKNVRSLQKEMKSQRSELIYHYRITDTVLSAINQCNYGDYMTNSTTIYEAVLGQLRFFNPSTPGTLTTGDGSSGTYQREYHFKTVYACLTAYNNYQVPAKVTIYVVFAKIDNTILPSVAVSNGLVDVGNPTFQSPMIHPTDSEQFNDLYKIVKRTTKMVMPGQSLTLSHSVGDVYYSPATVDSQTASYQTNYKAWGFLVRAEGTYGHDTVTASQVAQLSSGIDINLHKKFVVQYDAGTDLKFIYLNDASPAFTTGGAVGGVVSSKPVSDNIGYSVA